MDIESKIANWNIFYCIFFNNLKGIQLVSSNDIRMTVTLFTLCVIRVGP